MDLVAQHTPRSTPARTGSPPCCGPSGSSTRYGITAWQDAIVGELRLDGRSVRRLSHRGPRRIAHRPGRRRAVVGPRARRRADPRTRRQADGAEHGGRFRADSVKIMQDGVAETGTAALLDPVPRRLRLRHRQQRHQLRRPRRAAPVRHRTGRPRLPGPLPRPRRPRRARGTRRRRGGPHRERPHRHPAPPRPPPGRPPRRHPPVPRARRHGQHPAAVGRPRTADGRADHPLPRRRTRRAGSTRSARCCGPAQPLAAGSDWPVSSADPLHGIHVAVNRIAPDGEGTGLPARASASGSRPPSPRTRRASAHVNHLDDTGSHPRRSPRRPGGPGPRPVRGPARGDRRHPRAPDVRRRTPGPRHGGLTHR